MYVTCTEYIHYIRAAYDFEKPGFRQFSLTVGAIQRNEKRPPFVGENRDLSAWNHCARTKEKLIHRVLCFLGDVPGTATFLVEGKHMKKSELRKFIENL
jgi:hypothetical protein